MTDRTLHDDAIIIDPASRRNLEIDINQKGDALYTLAWVLDKTKTAMGGRMLRRWLHRPIRDKKTLTQRQDSIAALLANYQYEPVQAILKQIGAYLFTIAPKKTSVGS